MTATGIVVAVLVPVAFAFGWLAHVAVTEMARRRVEFDEVYREFTLAKTKEQP